MGLLAQLADVRRELQEWVRQSIAALIQVSQVTNSSSLGDRDATQGHQTFTGEPTYHYQTRRYQHFGFRSRPPAGVTVIRLIASGGAVNTASIAEESTAYGPNALNDGEAALYNKVAGLVILLDQNGTITIRAKSGQQVLIDDGSGAVALATKADLDALAAWIATHKHGGVTTGGGVSGVFDPATSGTEPSAVGTTVLKGK